MNRQILPSVCALDCPDTCALRVTLDGDRIVQITGAADHPITQGFACVKTVRYAEHQEHPGRLLYPQRRCGPKGQGKFQRVSWDEALDEIADRLRSVIERAGPRAILPFSYAGTMGLIQRDHPLSFFRALGACELDWTICAASGSAGWEFNYGPLKVGVAPEQIPNAQMIILWGINALRSNSHIAPLIKRARESGARVLHIDPYRNETSRLSDEHWQLNVGTDTALALSIAGEIFRLGLHDEDYLRAFGQGVEEYRAACTAWPIERAAEFCGLPAERISAVAREYAETPVTFLKPGYGLTRNESGGNAMRAISLLPAVTGVWRRGGGAMLSTSGAFPLNTTRYSGLHLKRPDARHVNQNLLASTLLETPATVEALVVFNSNPAAVAPDSNRVRAGLSRDDLLTVVLEHFQTDTADYADFLLPATTFLEHADLYTAYGHYFLQWAEPILPARGECRPNTWVFEQLAMRLGLNDPTLFWTAEQLARDLLDSPHPWLGGLSFDRLQRERSVRLQMGADWMAYGDGSHFPDRRIRFSPPPEQLAFQERCDESFPLRLISPPGSHFINTSMGNAPSLIRLAGGQPQVLVHPVDADRFGLLDGRPARLVSRYGAIQRLVRVSTDARQGTVVALGLWWPKLAPDGKGLNDLTSERLTDLGGGSTFGNVAVSVAPAYDMPLLSDVAPIGQATGAPKAG
jgi:anaerobic selenocysteine-containing dehydrogenase